MLGDLVAFALAAIGSQSASGPDPALCQQTYGQRACRGTALAPLRAELAHKFAAVMLLQNRTATWQGRHDRTLAEIRAAVNYDGKPMDDEELAQRFRDAIADYDQALTQGRTTRPAIKTPSAHGQICMSQWLDQGCTVPASGVLRDGDRVVHWQMMKGASGEDGTGAGIVLWHSKTPGTAQLIGWSFDGVIFDPPRLTQDGRIWVPGRRAGTGDGNADLLFAWDEASRSWQDIDLESWQHTVQSKLPRGFAIWKGIDYDFNGMGGTSKLWRSRDPNCCPSGGEARLEFAIEGRTLVLKAVDVDIVEKWAPRKD